MRECISGIFSWTSLFENSFVVFQGTSDQFLEKQLKPTAFVEAAQAVNAKVNVRMQDGYDHSYYFISSFIGDHIDHHAKHLLA